MQKTETSAWLISELGWPRPISLDGWMTDLRFYAFSTVFKPYKDDGRVIMKLCTMESRFRLRRFRLEEGLISRDS